MSGPTARRGFRFQDHYFVRQILEHIAARQEAILSGEPSPPNLTFGIETPLNEGVDTLDWDTVVIGTDQVEVAEVKSGAVDKADRYVFWRRVRAQLVAAGDQSIEPCLT